MRESLAPAQATRPAGDAQAWGGLLLLLALALLVFTPALRILAEVCRQDGNSSHIFFVPLISAYLVWGRRAQLAPIQVRSSARGLALLLLGLALYILGRLGQVQLLSNLALVISLIGLVWFNLGEEAARALRFPLLFLFFLVPVPDSLIKTVAFPLQLFATRVSAAIMGLLSIPVLREGNMLYFANTQLEVAEACSGIRSMMAFLMLGSLFAYLVRGGAARRLLLVALAFPLAVAMNVLRVTGTGVLAYRYGSEVAQGFLHEFSGLLVFAAGFLVMAGLYLVLDRRAPDA